MKDRNESKETETRVKKSEPKAKKLKLEEYALEIAEIYEKIREIGRELADLERVENQYKGQDLILMSVNADEFNPEILSNAQHLVALRDAEGAYTYKLWASQKGKWQLFDLKLDQNFVLPPEWHGQNKVFVSMNNPIFKLLNQKDTLSMGTSLKIKGENEKIFKEESAKIRALSDLLSKLNFKRADLETALTQAENTKATIKRGREISNLVADPKKISDKIKGLTDFNDSYERFKTGMQRDIDEIYFLAKEFAVKKEEINVDKLIAAGNTIFLEEPQELNSSITIEAPAPITNYTFFNDPQNKKKSEPEEVEKKTTPKSLASSKRKSGVLKEEREIKRQSETRRPDFITKEAKKEVGPEPEKKRQSVSRSVSSKRLKSKSTIKPAKFTTKLEQSQPQVQEQPQVKVSTDRPRRPLERQHNVTEQQRMQRQMSKPDVKKHTYFAEKEQERKPKDSGEELTREDSQRFKK
ncbi:Uncharacterised protein [Legionella beliardensis]|uniref:Uncharacterized protein n=1 Tax=Legionella beliardensis TaxID=91822 RepID=A0A378I3H0_9GAMM|nr:hypothetical protein [Legionella beliardensis]STX29236.1 Uncharacterised protein [Legionella beliardensis]